LRSSTAPLIDSSLEENTMTEEDNIRRGNTAIWESLVPMLGPSAGFEKLIDAAGDARFVLIGEASHGTHEFYEARAEITRHLIEKKGFNAVAVEADWPDAYRINRFVRGTSADRNPAEALSSFERFPQWMWRNTVVHDFAGWLRAHNNGLVHDQEKTGFYGMDLYSLNRSAHAVIDYLDRVDPEAAKRARYRYGCFDHYGEDTQAYGYAANFGMGKSCESEVVQQLMDMQKRAAELSRRDGRVAEDEFFFAEQNARLVKNSEEYYRTMFLGRISSWNLRDKHMVDTLDALVGHLERHGRRAKIVVWAHNSHLGDARATEMGDHGEWNVGQLVREKWGRESFLIGFTTCSGSVMAASDWDAPAERKTVRPALPGSYEALFHLIGVPHFFLCMQSSDRLRQELTATHLERAIGVIYRPESERISHYFDARLAEQFDAVIHIDRTTALTALRHLKEDEKATPETFPVNV
jgi:erythromycin esterase-like protein